MPHLHEKVDFTVETFIVYQQKVLLRQHDKYHIWLAVGGHIELDEDPPHAAIREVKEEVGLDVILCGSMPSSSDIKDYRELLPPRFLNRHRINETHEHVSMVYFATAQSDVVTQGETEQSVECRWFTAKELRDPEYGIRDSIVHYALAALEECGQ